MKFRAPLAVVLGRGSAGEGVAHWWSQRAKVFPTRSHTVAAQGGIGASLGNMGEDNWRWHMYDTVKGSDWLGDQDAIEFMCRRRPPWSSSSSITACRSTAPDGTIYQRPFGGMTANYGEKHRAARLRRRRPHRPRDAAHALPAVDSPQRAIFHRILRRRPDHGGRRLPRRGRD
jgi:succinate dehydrogenase/fumarate reductase flavoprotein subunit